MLPATYQLPAAAIFLVGGIVACFFGYRLFRVVLAIFGFIFGAALASSLFGVSDTWAMVAAWIIGGLIGAAVLMAAYFVGVALVGASLGVTIANIFFAAGDRDPKFLVVVASAVIGAIAAMYLQRYFIIVGTAFGGAWTMIVGALAMIGDKAARQAAASNDVWVVYPLDPAPGRRWVTAAWVVLGLIGAAVQLGWTAGDKGRVVRRKKK
jgi:Domain of unknown function (DUF4203)